MKSEPAAGAGPSFPEGTNGAGTSGGHLSRLRVLIGGAVQGVGFRPFVFRLAKELALDGWIRNSTQGVQVEVEGPPAVIEKFLVRLRAEKPGPAYIGSLESTWLDPLNQRGFEIRASAETGVRTAFVLPDLATCQACRREIFDPTNRRFRYPFTNCTHCGPRFTIIEALPYDRSRTSMKSFPMCGRCRAEFEDPADRRFHAQPNACPDCGPQLELWDDTGSVRASQDRALRDAVSALRAGRIVAVKGLGGFHLMALAGHGEAVERLRRAKHREEKPFALMFPSVSQAAEVCEIGEAEEALLKSAEAPIVFLKKRPGSTPAGRAGWLCEAVAPGNPWLGIMLPYTPLHHLLMAELGRPLVATSGNRADEPICVEEHEALERLGGIAELFLVHNRPIVRHVDDSIVRVVGGREMVLRRARGYAPMPVPVRAGGPCVLAVGAHLKNTVALGMRGQVFLSQHIGDLETEQALTAFRRVIGDFEELYDERPEAVAADAHPDYLSTRHAAAMGRPVRIVQHHYAHIISCMLENELEPPVLGIAWDGTGYGTDGTVWGGEFFDVQADRCQRVAHLRPFRLPGGELAVKEPRRAALGVLYELGGAALLERTDVAAVRAWAPVERRLLKRMLERGVNAPLTSSVGRLFDAVAAILGLREVTHYEGQGAMELEFMLADDASDDAYPVRLCEAEQGSAVDPEKDPVVAGVQLAVRWTVDWGEMISRTLADLADGVARQTIAARFHNGLAEAMVQVARHLGRERVVLSGGCFQNKYLLERSLQRLRKEGFRPYWHQRIPPNDGGIALGQVGAVWGWQTRMH